MPPALTIITPIAPAHLALFEQCAASVARQTIAVEHLYKIDEDQRGPAYIRNLLIRQVQTPYVAFLDADDWFEQTYAERALEAINQKPDRYIYTDWLQDGKPIAAPDCAFRDGTFHLITSVIPTAWVQAVGGFDEHLSGMEDTDFWLKMLTSGRCGRRLPMPLVNYRRGGGRADRIHRTGEIYALQDEMARRYGGVRVSCCGDYSPNPELPVGEPQEGDVLAQAQWQGNHPVLGVATGRRYPRTSFPHQTWVAPADVAAAPHQWREVFQVPEPAPEPNAPGQIRGVAALHERLVSLGKVRELSPAERNERAIAELPVVAVTPIPNIRQVIRLARAAYGEVDVATFVMPRKHYPSYIDLWKLAELSGFEALYQDEVDLSDARQTFVFAAPETIPDCSKAKARTIFWALEYTGDYLSTENAQTVSEIWSSDPTHAKRTGAKYVLMGSHRHLNPDLKGLEPSADPIYDATMLAYMVGRRSAIKDRLSAYRWPQNYPGYDNAERHNLLRRTRLMLHVHQQDEPAMAPLRYAIAAAYHMPVISENVPDHGAYGKAIIWSEYDDIPSRVKLYLDGKAEDDAQYAEKLHQLLCVERPFRANVIEALEQGTAVSVGNADLGIAA